MCYNVCTDAAANVCVPCVFVCVYLLLLLLLQFCVYVLCYTAAANVCVFAVLQLLPMCVCPCVWRYILPISAIMCVPTVLLLLLSCVCGLCAVVFLLLLCVNLPQLSSGVWQVPSGFEKVCTRVPKVAQIYLCCCVYMNKAYIRMRNAHICWYDLYWGF